MLNTGISFGLMPGLSLWVYGLVIVLLVIYAVKMRELWGRIGVGFIILGGSGNLASRIIYGGVVDNLSFFGLFYNNVWDWMIGVGVGIYGLQFFLKTVGRKL